MSEAANPAGMDERRREPGAAGGPSTNVEAVRDAIVTLDRDGRIRSWSPQAEKSFGWTEPQVLGRFFADAVIPIRHRDAHRVGLVNYLQSGEASTLGKVLELSAVRAGGEEFPVEIAISPALGQGADVTFVAFIRDISARIAADEASARSRVEDADILRQKRSVEASQARQHAERMRELEHLKTEFMKLASHELRGPLTVIRGYLSMLAEGSLTEVAQVLPVLVSKADHMNLLLNQMLEVARLEEGGVRLTLKRTDLRSLVAEAFEMLRPAATANHDLTIEVGDQQLDVMVDPTRVRDIVASLLDNAIKYSPEGGRVTCGIAANADAVLVSVTDEGVGISPSEMPRLFTRFGRIVNADNSQINGSGMGLYVAREVALLHGGDLVATSQPGVGTTFRLTLPLASTLERRQSAGARAPQPIGQYGFDLANLQLNDMVRLGSALKRIVGEATDVEGAADAVARHLYGQLIDTERGRRGCALVRVYKTEPYALLREDEAAFARAAAQDVRPAPDMKCLTLVGSAGDLAEWNEPGKSRGHRVIPLPSESAVAASPMVAQLLKQLGLDVGALVASDASLLLSANPGTYGVFYVPEAVGSLFIPAQDDFVVPHGIKSVVGFGGLLVNGEVLVVILFTKVAVPKATAAMFRVLTHPLLRSFEPVMSQQRT